MPSTGNIPEIIPIVTEKASFSGVNPSFGTSRNGIRILLVKDSVIFRDIYRQDSGSGCTITFLHDKSTK